MTKEEEEKVKRATERLRGARFFWPSSNYGGSISHWEVVGDEITVVHKDGRRQLSGHTTESFRWAVSGGVIRHDRPTTDN